MKPTKTQQEIRNTKQHTTKETKKTNKTIKPTLNKKRKKLNN